MIKLSTFFIFKKMCIGFFKKFLGQENDQIQISELHEYEKTGKEDENVEIRTDEDSNSEDDIEFDEEGVFESEPDQKLGN